MPRYPRVVCAGTIVSPARWHIRNYGGEGAAALCSRLALPSWVALTRFDQQLVFDLDKAADVRFFDEAVAGARDFTLSEFLMPAELVRDERDMPLVNQFIAFLGNTKPSYRGDTFRPAPKKAERNFILGSSWLYLKIYCTPAAANGLIAGKILPAMRALLKKEAKSWFFIRYSDTSHHIRLRILVNEGGMGEVVRKLRSRFLGLVRSQVVRSYEADVYTREIERYGSRYIVPAEWLFHCSSELVAGFLRNNIEGAFTPEQLAIPSCLLLLEQFFPNSEGQLAFLERVNASFQKEFRADRALRLDLDKLYREIRGHFAGAAEGAGAILSLGLGNQWAAFARQGRKIAGLCRKEEGSKRATLLADLLHMHLNRLFAARQREQEMVLYYCLLKYKNSQLARQRRVNADVL
jgi:thiopeptide-type bacteriocin biosynthesis protein